MKVIVQPLLYTLAPQFYIQLVNKPHFGTQALLFGLFGPIGQLRAVRRKINFSFPCVLYVPTSEGDIFHGQKKYCTVHTKKLLNIKVRKYDLWL